MHNVYILKSKKNGRFYIGYSENVQSRLRIHNRGSVRATKSGIPWIVVHEEQFPLRQDAYRRERQIKRYKGGNAFKKLLS